MMESERRAEKRQRALRWLKSVPPLPKTVEKILCLPETSTSITVFADLISSDQRLSVKVLRLVNSDFFGLPSQISSLRQAVPLLGVRSLKGFALSEYTLRLFRRAGPGLDPVRFLRHALVVGLSGYKIAEWLGLPWQEEIYLAGLVHDIGLALISQYQPTPFFKLALPGKEGSPASLSAELEEFGDDHPEVGHQMALRWRLPAMTGLGIRYHHTPLRELPAGLGNEAAQVVGVLQVADGYARSTGHAFSDFDRLERLSSFEAYERKTFSVDAIDAMVGDLVPMMANLDSLFTEKRNEPLQA
jgi:HD-like signal output (HDOD) protein